MTHTSSRLTAAERAWRPMSRSLALSSRWAPIPGTGRTRSTAQRRDPPTLPLPTNRSPSAQRAPAERLVVALRALGLFRPGRPSNRGDCRWGDDSSPQPARSSCEWSSPQTETSNQEAPSLATEHRNQEQRRCTLTSPSFLPESATRTCIPPPAAGSVTPPRDRCSRRSRYVLAKTNDREALERLAALDSTEPPRGSTLVGALLQRPVAALSLSDGRVIADPFVRQQTLSPCCASERGSSGTGALDREREAPMTRTAHAPVR